MYAVTVRLELKKDSWTSNRYMPTFYLDERVQGILNEDQAANIAIDMFEDTLDATADLINNEDVQVFCTAVKV